jgi:hypothetical protein
MGNALDTVLPNLHIGELKSESNVCPVNSRNQGTKQLFITQHQITHVVSVCNGPSERLVFSLSRSGYYLFILYCACLLHPRAHSKDGVEYLVIDVFDMERARL